MFHASDFGVRLVLGQRRGYKPFVIYYASKMLDEAQLNYSTRRRCWLWCLLLRNSANIFWDPRWLSTPNHSAIKHLMGKRDVKPRLIQCVLLLQEFALKIWDKGIKKW